jgi:DNA-binding transcriptional regulator YdaS (Cro superfamily)
MNLYIIQCDNFIKIGIARNLNSRLSSMQSGNPKELVLKAFFETGLAKKAEKKAHAKLSKYRVTGEWFDCSFEDARKAVLLAINEVNQEREEMVRISESFVIETRNGETLTDAMRRQSAENLNKAVEYFGSQKNLAIATGATKQTVNNWIKRGKISATAAIEVERLTKGEITKQKLRPDVVAWME